MEAGSQSAGAAPTSTPWKFRAATPTTDIGRADELCLPEIVGEDDQGAGAGSGVVLLFDHAAYGGTYAENGEIAARDELSGDGVGIAAGREIHGNDVGAAENTVEEVGLCLEIAA
jgi:hypothetical protein